MLVRSPLLTSRKWRELVSSWGLVCRCDYVFFWCYLCFVLLRFRLYAFIEAAALRSIVLRYAGAPIATSVFFLFPLLFIWRCHFFRVFFCTIAAFSLNGEYVVRAFLQNSVFLPYGHGMDLTSAYVRIQPINQSINQLTRSQFVVCCVSLNQVILFGVDFQHSPRTIARPGEGPISSSPRVLCVKTLDLFLFLSMDGLGGEHLKRTR